MDSRVEAVLEIAARKIAEPLLVNKLAPLVYLSPSHFEHLFKKETGQAFKTFVRGLRMIKARDMLADRTMRVKLVAAAVGYSDASDFTRDFRKCYGHSPSQARSPFPQQV